MEKGRKNYIFGWFWLGIFMVVGFAMEIALATNKEYAANFSGEQGTIGYTRELIRAAHAHGNLLSILNILYALFIDKTTLSDKLKGLGSWLAIIGAVLLPFGLLGLSQGMEVAGALSALGGLTLIVAVFLIAFGNMGRKE